MKRDEIVEELFRMQEISDELFDRMKSG